MLKDSAVSYKMISLLLEVLIFCTSWFFYTELAACFYWYKCYCFTVHLEFKYLRTAKIRYSIGKRKEIPSKLLWLQINMHETINMYLLIVVYLIFSAQLNSVRGMLETIAPIIIYPLYNQLYKLTFETLPGAFFLITAAITVPVVILFG